MAGAGGMKPRALEPTLKHYFINTAHLAVPVTGWMPFNLKQHSKFEHVISMIGNQCLLLAFSFQIRFSLSLSHCQALVPAVAAYPGELKKGLMWRKMTIDIYVTVRRCRSMTDWWQPSGDRFLPELSTCEGDAVCGTHWSALQPETICNNVFKIFQNAQSQQKESRNSNTKCPQGSWQKCLCQRNLACLNSSSWQRWLFPLSSSLFFFSSWFPTTSWGLSHCGLCFYQQWNTETPFTAAELVSWLEFGFLKVSCLLLESSHTSTQPQTCTQRMLPVLWLE